MKVTDIPSLRQQIALLESRQQQEKEEIKQEVSAFVESLKPGNMLRSAISSVGESSELKDDILHGLVGLGTGFVTNKMLLGSLEGPIKKVLATVLQVGITNAAVKYPDAIKEKGISLLTRVLQAIRIGSDHTDHHSNDRGYQQ